MDMGFYFFHQTQFPEVLHYLLSCFHHLHSLISFSGIFIHLTSFINNFYRRKVVMLTNLGVSNVVGGSYFDYAGAKFHINCFVGYNFEFYFFCQRRLFAGNIIVNRLNFQIFADVITVFFVVRMNRKSGVAKFCFRSGCSQGERPVFYIIKMALLGNMVNLKV